jgi:hypothetical protein
VDSAPLQGAGRVEDTINLLWHAARKIVELLAAMLQLDKEAVCQQAGIPLLLSTSAKRALDVDWSEPQAKDQALEPLIEQLESLVPTVRNGRRRRTWMPILRHTSSRWASCKSI